MALHTGARANELLQAKWRDIDLERGLWTIPDSKNLSPRTVPLNSELFELLKPLQGLPEAYVVTRNGKPIPVEDLSKAFKRAVRRVGRGDLRFHDLRHIFASRLLANGASLPEIAALLGHKTLSISARYSHTSPERLRALVSTLLSVKPAESAKVVEFPKKE
jgi:integrase